MGWSCKKAESSTGCMHGMLLHLALNMRSQAQQQLAHTLGPFLLLQNDLEFLRIRSFKHEIMVAASGCQTALCWDGTATA